MISNSESILSIRAQRGPIPACTAPRRAVEVAVYSLSSKRTLIRSQLAARRQRDDSWGFSFLELGEPIVALRKQRKQLTSLFRSCCSDEEIIRERKRSRIKKGGAIPLLVLERSRFPSYRKHHAILVICEILLNHSCHKFFSILRLSFLRLNTSYPGVLRNNVNFWEHA